MFFRNEKKCGYDLRATRPLPRMRKISYLPSTLPKKYL